MNELRVIYRLLILVIVGYHITQAQSYNQDVVFKVFVTDCDNGVPLNGIVFGKKGGSWESEATDEGMTKIKVTIIKAGGRATGSHVELFLLTKVPANRGWEMLHDGRVIICDYKNPEAYSPVALKNKRHSQLSQIQQAEEQLIRKLTKSTEDAIKLSLASGQMQYAEGDYVGAVRTFKQALEQDPDNHVILHNLAKALTQAGRYEEARSAFDKCVSIREDSRRATPEELVDTLESYAALLLRMGKKVDAEKIQERVTAILRDIKQLRQ